MKLNGRSKKPTLRPYFIKCPCKRGYMKEFAKSNVEGIPMAFAVGNGYLLIQGWCDTCTSLIQFAAPLADLTFNDDYDWEVLIEIVGRRK